MFPISELRDISELIRDGKLRKTYGPILLYLAEHGGQARFTEIYQHLSKKGKLSKSTLKTRLDALSNLGIITYKQGAAELRNKTTLCFMFGCSKISYYYMGLLGIRTESPEVESEPETAIKLLKEEGIEFSRIYVATTPEALDSWKDFIDEDVWKRIEPLSVRIDEMNDIEKMIKRVESKLLELIGESITLLDCTSGTRPAGIAFHILAEKYKLPLIYVYKDTQRIYWLRSRNTLKRELTPII
ncbi:MAG: hypothetical protein ACK4TI_00090 [Nitrososphaerales archaeon]